MLSARGRDRLGGGLLLVLGLAASWQGVRYQVGSLTDMGPGFFPVAIGIGLAGIGILIAIGRGSGAPAGAALVAPVPQEHAAGPQLRGWTCIALSLAAFILLGEHLGLAPATFAVTFIAALGDRRNGVVRAALLAGAVLVVSVVVFWWALGLQFDLVRADW